MKRKKEQPKITAAYRCRLTCSIGKKAAEGETPKGVSQDAWKWNLLFSAIDDLAMAIEEVRK